MKMRVLVYGALWCVVAGSQGALGAQGAPLSEGPTYALTLGDAVRLAARNTAAVREAQDRVDQAHARVHEARAALLPGFDVRASDGTRTFNSASLGFTLPPAPGQPPTPTGEVIGPVRSLDYRGNFAQALFDPGALRRLRSTQTLARASATDVAAVGEEAGTVAALAYVQTLRGDAECRARSADSALAADLVAIAEHQFQAGVGIALDVTRARTQLASVRAQLIASRNARDRTRLALLRALDLPLTTPLHLRDSLESLTLGNLATDASAAVRRALANRPDLRAADQRLTATRQSVSAIRAERLPTLRLVGDDGMNGNGRGHLLHTYTYAFELSIPVFDGALREARLQEHRAQVHEAEVRDADLRRQAEVDVRMALLDLASAREQVQAAREAAQLAEEGIVQARDRFEQGVAGNADVVTAMLARTGAQTALIDALANAQYARIGLAGAQGVLTTLP